MGTKTCIDPSRKFCDYPVRIILKDPTQPHLITCWSLPGYGNPVDPAIMEAALYGVNVADGNGGRHELGDPSLAAPSLEWCIKALQDCDPNQLDREDLDIDHVEHFKLKPLWKYLHPKERYSISGHSGALDTRQTTLRKISRTGTAFAIPNSGGKLSSDEFRPFTPCEFSATRKQRLNNKSQKR